MFIGRTAILFIIANLLAFCRHVGWAHPIYWSADSAKRNFGRSRQCLEYLFNSGTHGYRKFNRQTIIAICNATGIRYEDLTGKLVNMNTYSFDIENGRREHQTHVDSKYGLISKFGLDIRNTNASNTHNLTQNQAASPQ